MPMVMQGYLPDRSAPLGDRIGACALLILFLPLMIFVAVAIKCDSKGPIVVRARRVDGGRQFVAFKFRCTSHDDSFGHPTRVGWFLRFTSIEDLPQLYNVFRGEMSCLNPRPDVPFFLD
jgi:lipopolysaccharide/colanic/teichoic acid biosynthesis glycosyltransferase